MLPDLSDRDQRHAYADKVSFGDPIEPTEDHLTLIRRSVWGWDPTEFGAAEISAKRPYGNSDVEEDLAGLLPHLSPNERIRVHCELPAVMQWIVRNRI